MAAASTDSGQPATRITPQALQDMLRFYNLSRREFINTYNIQPLVYVPELPYSAKATFVLLYALIFALALAGNCLVVYIVVKKRAVQTATDVFICSLAVSDLLITFFCVPFTLLQNLSSEWFGGESPTPAPLRVESTEVQRCTSRDVGQHTKKEAVSVVTTRGICWGNTAAALIANFISL